MMHTRNWLSTVLHKITKPIGKVTNFEDSLSNNHMMNLLYQAKSIYLGLSHWHRLSCNNSVQNLGVSWHVLKQSPETKRKASTCYFRLYSILKPWEQKKLDKRRLWQQQFVTWRASNRRLWALVPTYPSYYFVWHKSTQNQPTIHHLLNTVEGSRV